ncbi:MAG: HypC/HybG/HupF family hydrogenase formation chaperone [Synechococcus sp.]
MCLAVPGQIISIVESSMSDDLDGLYRMGKVRFGGVVKQVSLAYVPEAAVGDYVVVHVGCAIATIDEDEAQQTLQVLSQLRAQMEA